MNLNIDFTPQEEARFRAFARQKHTDPATLAKKLLTQPLPPGYPVIPVVDEENSAAIALLDTWLEQEATSDPEEIRKAESDLAEFKRNINANRAETGERQIYR